MTPRGLTMAQELTSKDVEMLQVLNGDRELEYWGAWCTSALEFLHGHGFCTKGPKYDITPAGRAALEALNTNKDRP